MTPKIFISLLSALLLAGCFQGPDTPPSVQTLAKQSIQPLSTELQPWWEQFQDAELNALIAQAFEENLDLKAARERVKQAYFSARKSGASVQPSVSLGASSAVKRDLEEGGSDSEPVETSLSLSYSIDLWGKLRNQIRSAEYTYLAQEESYVETRRLLIASIVDAWIRLAEERATTALLEEQIAVADKVLSAIETRYAAGKVDASDVLQQRRQLVALHAEMISAKSDRESQRYALAVLIGRSPQEVGLFNPSLMEPLELEAPRSEWLQHRSDVRAAFYGLKSDNESLAAAIAERYPSLTLSASLSGSASGWSSLFESWIAQVLGSVSHSLWDGGSDEAEMEQAGAQLTESAYLYRQTLLEAAQEVEEAWMQVRYQKEMVDNLATQRRLAQEAFERIAERYGKGAASYLDSLTALNTWQELERQLLSAQRELLGYQVDLHTALGRRHNSPTRKDSQS